MIGREEACSESVSQLQGETVNETQAIGLGNLPNRGEEKGELFRNENSQLNFKTWDTIKLEPALAIVRLAIERRPL